MHTDQKLLKRIQHGESKALEELYERYSTFLYNLIKRKVKDAKKIFKLIKQLFHEIWHNPQQFLQDTYVSKSFTKYCMNHI